MNGQNYFIILPLLYQKIFDFFDNEEELTYYYDKYDFTPSKKWLFLHQRGYNY